MSERTAIVLFNLGGPDGPAAVEPFLKNLFSDPAILRVPALLRAFLARTISKRRAPIAREIYQQMGGGSPILPNTKAQAKALTAALSDLGQVESFIAMRYWHPRAKEAAEKVAAFAPTRIVLLPLYPQFSTTTTASSLKEWQEVAGSIAAPVHAVCCYPRETGFISSLAALIGPKLAEAAQKGRPRLLLSAHGLPEKVVKSGDPYQWQVEESARALKEKLGDVDLVICYQSRVGPMKWIGPATVDEVKRAGADKVPLVVAPVAFVSEHSETLVELDIELRHVAEEAGVPFYARVPTVDCSQPFIAGLARLVRDALARGPGLAPDGGKRICGAAWGGCPCKGE